MRTGKGLKPLILLPALLTLMNSKWTGVRPSTEPLGVIPWEATSHRIHYPYHP